MKIETAPCTPEIFREAKVAGLYRPTGYLFDYYDIWSNGNNGVYKPLKLVTARHYRSLIGVAVIAQYRRGFKYIWTYVQPKYRRRKVATKMIKLLVADTNESFTVFKGAKNALGFWNSFNGRF